MVNINGLPKINGENYPLDIWSLYMQNAVSKFPEQQFDVPNPSLDLEVKTDGLAYMKPPEPETTAEETTESTTGAENFADGLTDGFDAPESTNAFESTVPETTNEFETTTPSASSSASALSSATPRPDVRPPRRERPGVADPQRPGRREGQGPQRRREQSPLDSLLR